MSESLAMGGYGAYVWSCIALTAIVLIICAAMARRRQRIVVDDIRVRLCERESGK